MPTVNLEQAQHLTGQLQQWAYNALDCTGTREIVDILLPRLNPNQARTYAFERALQAPALSMSMRGCNIDEVKRNEMVTELKRELKRDMAQIAKLPAVRDVWDGTRKEIGFCDGAMGKKHKWPRGVPDGPARRCERCDTPRIVPDAFNPGSPLQTTRLFYTLHKVPPLKNKMGKMGKVSTDEDVLERIGHKHPHLKPITDAILGVRDKKKQLGSLEAKLSKEGRYTSTFNVGAAWTGRFSSSKSPFREGGNLQNWAERHRKCIIADYGKDIGYADYAQAESETVAHLSGDQNYIEAHKSGDVHTYVCRMTWPNDLPWTGDMKRDKKLAQSMSPPWDQSPGHDYRFQSKAIQHGSNLGLTPYGISMQKRIPLKAAKLSYERYMTEFEGIPAWQKWVANEIQNHRPLINPLGRQITLFGRPWDQHTINQGYAFLPQSTIADILDIALWRVWKELEPMGLDLLAQVHDAILHQLPRGAVDLEKRVLELMTFPVPVTDIHGITRGLRLNVETMVGRNWSKGSETNPYGIKEIQ